MPFTNAIVAGENLVRTAIQSPNFDQAAKTGWRIDRNGNAYFFSLTAAGAVTSNTVVVNGAGDGVFVYDGTPAPGSLVVAIASAAGSDEYGNAYSGPGICVSAPGPGGAKNEIQIRPDKQAVFIYAA